MIKNYCKDCPNQTVKTQRIQTATGTIIATFSTCKLDSRVVNATGCNKNLKIKGVK